MTFNIIVLEKQKYFLILSLFRFFVNFLLCLINDRSRITLFSFEEGATEHSLRGRKNFTASTAFSHKFHLNFYLLSLFVVLFVTIRKIE